MTDLPLKDALRSSSAVEAIVVPFKRYRFAFSVTEPVGLPDYAGSQIRGSFGRALRRICCMTRQKDCKSCPLYRTCAYTQVFETPPPPTHPLQHFSQIPNAYVIEPEGWGRRVCEPGETLEFDLVLIGRARDSLALVIYAFQKAFSFDIGRGKAELIRVQTVDGQTTNTIFDSSLKTVREHEQGTRIAVPDGSEIHLQIQTPLRLQQNGVPLLPGEVTAYPILTALLRRIALLYEFQCLDKLDLNFHQLSEMAGAVALESSLEWVDWIRYSSRQNRHMNLGGVTGSIVLRDVPPEFRVLLAAGQLSHVGKNATFGLGRYRIEIGR